MQGQLRKGVNVTYSDDTVRIAFALWTIELPKSWVQSKPIVQNLLERKCTNIEAALDPEVQPLLRLLDAQGCFIPEMKDSYTLREVRARFDPLKSVWYATYYSHPTWSRIRDGAASRNELIAWMLHNYHISRSAGVIGARLVAMNRKGSLSKFFEQDVLEEYWHCDAYYFVDAPNLKINPDDAKLYIPLPSSLAFEQHALQVSETDPLGHILIAYFQESSIAFKQDSDEFYRQVEEVYNIPSFFESWKQHIQIDIEHHHADGLAALLVSDDLVDSSTFTRSIKNAWLAFAFLNSSLEEIREEQRNKDEICLRLPIRNGRVRQTALSLNLKNLTSIDDGTHSFFNLEDMFRWYTSVSSSPVLKHEQKTSLIASSFPYLRQEIARSAFRALSFSRNHDEIIACGYIARSFSSLDNNRNFSPVMLWDVAITNYLYEAATYPVGWTMFLDLLLSRTNSFGEIASNLTDQNNEPNLCSRLRHDITAVPLTDK